MFEQRFPPNANDAHVCVRTLLLTPKWNVAVSKSRRTQCEDCPRKKKNNNKKSYVFFSGGGDER